MKIIIDAMGGDFAPEAPVRGALLAREKYGADIILTGRTADILRELEKAGCKEVPQGIEIANAEEVVEICDDPATAFKQKKDSSLTVGLNLLRDGQADGFISAGSTGALLAGATLVVKRIRGLRRAALAPTIPTMTGKAVLIDCGANVDARPSNLVQFAKMGSIYMESVMGVKNPKVGIVNIGAEEEKGNALVKETFPLLKACPDINFVGSVEARDIPAGVVDVVVCEAFTGNVILKTYEGVGATLISKVKKGMMSSLRSKIGALLVKPALKQTLKAFDLEQYGGAPMLGLKGLVVKTHGSSKSVEIKNSILQCVTFQKQQINEKIKEKIQLADAK